MSDPDHKLDCLGLLRGRAGAVTGDSGYVETDPDGDQVLGKVTPAPHRLSVTKDLGAVWERLLGTGKYSGASKTMKVTCQPSSTGITAWTHECDAGR
jgi:hypothetical protein